MIIVMTTPRLGFTENMFCVTQASVKLGMTLQRTQGVFWTQGIDRALTDAVSRENVKWCMTVDYDTCFHWSDVVKMRTIAEANGCEILVPLQAGRERSCPLFTKVDAEGKLTNSVLAADMERDCVEIDTGHFGMTLIARDPLRKLRPDDRLVGAAALCVAHGIEPVHCRRAIAAAAQVAGVAVEDLSLPDGILGGETARKH